MKVKKSDGSDFRVVLIGMITNSVVLSRISQQWSDDGLFGDRWCNRIGGWCLKYYRKYNEPPKSKIRDIFESWANRDPDNPMVDPIEKFLASLSDQYESADITPDYILDRAGEVFNKVRIRKLIEDVELKLDQDQSEAAYEQLVSLSKVQLGEGALVKVATDFDAWADAFHELEHTEVLIPYPRTLHNFFGQWLTRDSLYAVMASDKQGKSVILLDMAVRALRNRKRVAYFDTGDMSQRQVMRRLGTRVARIPISPTDVKFPRSVSHDGDVEFESRNFKKGLSLREAYRAINKASWGKDLLRVACYPNSTISVNGIQSVLQDWAREGWVCDIAILDYADILADPPKARDNLESIDDTWKQMRRLSQEMHCLVVTATQANAAAYGRKDKLLDKSNFSGRKTKLAHVNGMIGINTWPGDKKKGVIRLNWIVRREGIWDTGTWLTAAGCWSYYSPFVVVQDNTWEATEEDDNG